MPAAERDAPDPRRWHILALLAVAQLMVVLDATIVNIALPSAQKSLGFSNDGRQWIVTAYALAFGSLLLLGGKLGDLFGRKWTFVVGLIGFAGASTLGGFAPSFSVLVGARALQGVFGALLAPSALSLLTVTFTDPKERSKAFGVFGATAGAGGSVGLLLGGVLTETLSWRWCLYVNLLIAIPAVLFGLRMLTNARPDERPGINVPSVVTATGGAFALVYGFSSAETSSWTAATTLFALAASLVLVSAFVVLQSRVAHPLLPLRILRDRGRAASYTSIALVGAAAFAVFLFLTYYLQQNLRYSPIKTGLAFLPMTAAIVVTSTASQIVVLRRTGPKPLVVGGMAFALAGMLLLTQLSLDSTYVGTVLPAQILIGLGMGAIIASSIATGTAGVDVRDAGVASAMVNTSQQVGGSIGTALLSTLYASAVSSYASTNGGGAGAAAVHGYAQAFTYAAAIFAIGLLIAVVVFPNGRPQQQGEPDVPVATTPPVATPTPALVR